MGLREDIQLVLGGMVADLRELVVAGKLSDDDVEAVVTLHDDVEALWRAALASTPPLPPETLSVRLRELQDLCVGPTAGFRVRFERALDKAEALQTSKKVKGTDTT